MRRINEKSHHPYEGTVLRSKNVQLVLQCNYIASCRVNKMLLVLSPQFSLRSAKAWENDPGNGTEHKMYSADCFSWRIDKYKSFVGYLWG